MARESQGLQIALIIFVMLTIILGVTTFLFFRRYEEADRNVKSLQNELSTEKAKASDAKTDGERLKEKMGFAADASLQSIDEAFQQDMKTYASALAAEKQFYRPLVVELDKLIKDRNDAEKRLRDENDKLKADFLAREAGKDGQIKQFDDAVKKAGADLLAERKNFTDERKRIGDDQKQIADALDKARKASQDAIQKVEVKLQESAKRLEQLSNANQQKSKQLRDVTRETMDIPDGMVRWVNQRNGTVWINLGRADSLSRQTSFSVYAQDATDVTKAGKKASIEVTQILGDHLAEARIVEDKASDPIMPGDKVYTPIWSPGQQRHFALAGFFDLDDDGRSDQAKVRNLIQMNGGVVDAEVDEKGERRGELNNNTRFLVLGKEPSTKGPAAVLTGYSKMIGDAERMGMEKIPLSELLQRMGWKNQTPVVRYGTGANPADFRAKPADGVPRTSTGNVTDLFPKRTPK